MNQRMEEMDRKAERGAKYRIHYIVLMALGAKLMCWRALTGPE